MVLGALRSALSAKVRDGELKVVQAFQFADHKTRNAMNTLANLKAGRTVLVVDNGENRNLEVVDVDTEDNVLVIKGAVPGPNGSYVMVRRAKR